MPYYLHDVRTKANGFRFKRSSAASVLQSENRIGFFIWRAGSVGPLGTRKKVNILVNPVCYFSGRMYMDGEILTTARPIVKRDREIDSLYAGDKF
jgi:hypothetical protein